MLYEVITVRIPPGSYDQAPARLCSQMAWRKVWMWSADICRFMIYLCHYLGIRPESAKMILQDTGHLKQHDPDFIEQLEQLLLSNYTVV